MNALTPTSRVLGPAETAAALKAMGGSHLGRLWPRNEDERKAALDAGYDLDRVLTEDDLVQFLAGVGQVGRE